MEQFIAELSIQLGPKPQVILLRSGLFGERNGIPGIRDNSLDAFGRLLREGLEGEGPTLREALL